MKEESLLLLSDLQKLINQVVLIDYTIIILEGDTFSVYGKEYAIDSSGHINVSAEDEFTSTEIKYPSRSI